MRQTREKRTPHLTGVIQRQCSCGGGKGACPKCGRDDAVSRGATAQSATRGGETLDARTRGFMERRFDHDFSHVRVRADSQAARSASAMNALAYTAGSNIVFGSGQFAPQSARGAKLLAHELAHVVQQDRHPLAQGIAAKGVSESSDAAEREADGAAESVVGGNEKVTIRQAPAAPVQRVSAGGGAAIGLGIAGTLGIAGLIGWKAGLFDGKSASDDDVPTLEDPKFKKVWDENVRAGAEFMATTPSAKNCQFPHHGEKNYDDAHWNEEQAKNKAGAVNPNERGYSPKKPGSETDDVSKQKASTYDAVTDLFAGLNSWSCDCRMYSELILLYAWHKSLTPKQFDKKFANFQLSREGSVGIGSQMLMPFEDASWEATPVGTKVAWSNDSDGAYPSWHDEHAIKTVKGATPEQHRYAAQDAGLHGESELSELDVKMALLRYDRNSPFHYRITDAALAQLKADGVPDGELKKLETIKGRDFVTEAQFVEQLADATVARAYFSKTVNAARINALTSEIRTYMEEHITRSRADIPK
jgi:hypothetical protein